RDRCGPTELHGRVRDARPQGRDGTDRRDCLQTDRRHALHGSRRSSRHQGGTMPWRATDAQQERLKFISLWNTGLYGKSELCARFDVSRPTGDALLRRWEAEGVAGLKDRSRAPRRSPQRIAPEVAQILIQARLAHPTWGPRKIRVWLAERMPEPELPAAS